MVSALVLALVVAMVVVMVALVVALVALVVALVALVVALVALVVVMVDLDRHYRCYFGSPTRLCLILVVFLFLQIEVLKDVASLLPK